MKMLEFLKNFHRSRVFKQGRKYKHSSSESYDYMNSLGAPCDDVERSYNQYLCQKWESETFLSSFAENLASLLIFIPYIIMFRCKSKTESEHDFDAVLTHDFLRKYLPNDYVGNYVYDDFNSGSLNGDDIRFIFNMIKNHPFSFYFNFKNMCRIASYSHMISKYRPVTVFCSAEYSFTSSILTYYCESLNVSHVNLMHGDKLFNIRDSFCRFSVFYVWDEFYITLFTKLKADSSVFKINRMQTPVSVSGNDNGHCTYYLQLHTYEQLLRIKAELEKSGMDYLVRPHPVYMNEDIFKVFSKDNIEDNTIDIWESIENCGIAISQDSTVLYQAYLSGVPIVIDDVSAPDYFEQLKSRDYIMLAKPHRLLSDVCT